MRQSAHNGKRKKERDSNPDNLSPERSALATRAWAAQILRTGLEWVTATSFRLLAIPETLLLVPVRQSKAGLF